MSADPQTFKQVLFTAKSDGESARDGEAGYTVSVDGKVVAEVDNDETDVGDHALDSLWAALGVEIKFDFD